MIFFPRFKILFSVSGTSSSKRPPIPYTGRGRLLLRRLKSLLRIQMDTTKRMLVHRKSPSRILLDKKISYTRASEKSTPFKSCPYLNGHKHQNSIDRCHFWEPISALGCHANQSTVCDDSNNTKRFERRLKNNERHILMVRPH